MKSTDPFPEREQSFGRCKRIWNWCVRTGSKVKVLKRSESSSQMPTSKRQESAKGTTTNELPASGRGASNLRCQRVGKEKRTAHHESDPAAADDIQPLLSDSREQNDFVTSNSTRKIKIAGPYSLWPKDKRLHQATTEATALLDTGSAVNLVSEEFFNRLKGQGHLSKCKVFEKPREDIRCASGRRLPVTAEVKLGWMLCEQASRRSYWEDTFLVTPILGFGWDIIIGRETMNRRGWCVLGPFEAAPPAPPPPPLIVAPVYQVTDCVDERDRLAALVGRKRKLAEAARRREENERLKAERLAALADRERNLAEAARRREENERREAERLAALADRERNLAEAARRREDNERG